MVFLFFLTISAVIWFLNAMGKEYTATLRYPVRFTNYPDNQVLIGELPSNLDLTVSAYGYTLIKHFLGRRLMPITVEVNSYSLNRMPDTETRNYYIPSYLTTNRIAGQLGSDIDILDIKPDTIFFHFTEMVTGRLPVKPVLELQFDQQFMMRGNVIVDPDSVNVSGPAAILDTMQFVPTRLLRKTGINQPVNENVGFPEFHMLNLSENMVRVNIPVEQFTEASIRIPLEIINLPDTLVLKTFPSEITVSYHVALTDYDRISRQQFKAVIDYNKVPEGDGRLDVEITNQPSNIRSMRFTPRHVDYIIEK